MTAALDLAKKLSETQDRDARIDLVEKIMDAGGFKAGRDRDDVVLFGELTAEQKEIAKLLAASQATASFGGWGLPREEKALRRWAGIDPPGALESLGPGGAPRWKLILDGLAAGTPWPEIQARAFEGLDAAGRFQALLDISSNHYGIDGKLHKKHKVRVGPDVVEAALQTAGRSALEIVRAHLAGLRGTGWDKHVPPLVLFMAEQGEPIPEAADGRFAWSKKTRPALEAIPPERRERLALERASRWMGLDFRTKLGDLRDVADLLVTDAVRAALRQRATSEEVAAEILAEIDALPAAKRG